jgi:hypothetical protein
MFVVGMLVAASPVSAHVEAVHWTHMSPVTSPAARYAATEAYDNVHHVVVLFGGFDGSQPRNDTWVWNGTNWKLMHPATSPPARTLHYMAYDSTHQYVILYGGVTSTWVNDTWTWDGTNWTQRTPAHTPGNRASYAGVTDDPAIGGVLLYGGYDQTNQFFDTWKWDGSDWVQVPTVNHPSYYLASLAYSSVSGKVLAYVQGTGETWMFDGTDWVRVFPAASPPARYENGMAAVGKGAALFGGGNGGPFFSDTWYFNGTTWVQLSGAGPSARGYISLAFDAARGKVVLFGGFNANSTIFRDTWTLGA